MKNQIVTFNNQNLNLIEHSNQFWLTSVDVAKALNYSDSNAITLLYSKHKSEFDDKMSQTIETIGSRNLLRKQRLFNREGAWLIGMFARTPKAAEFRKWVLNVLGAVADSQPVDKPVTVSEHTRSLPSGKKEIVLSEKARSEIGGIVKAVLQAEIRERENIRDVFREVIREEIADYALKKGIEPGEWNGTPTGDGLPFGSWAVSISHSLGAISCIFDQLKERNKKVVKLLSGD